MRIGALFLFSLAGGPAPAEAGEAPEGETPSSMRTVVEQGDEDEDGLAGQRQADARSPGLSTVIELEHEAGARPSDGLPEVLARAPATTVRSLGGLGQFAALSIRGSSSQQVQVFYEGVPLGDMSTGFTDLSAIPLDGLERVSIYRGFIPPGYGAAAIGGVVDVSGGGVVESWRGRARMGFGSFASRELGASVAGPLRPGLSFAARVGYAGSAGDFFYFDNGGTPDFRGDDATRRRLGNDYDRLAAQLRLDGESSRWRWSVQQFGWFREAGVPGPAAAQAREASSELGSTRSFFRVSRRSFWAPGGRLDWVGSLGWSQRVFGDPEGELGVGIDDQRTRTLDTYLAPSMRLPLWRGAFLGLQADWREGRVQIDERASAEGNRSGDSERGRTQLGTSLSLEQFLADGRVQLLPVLRVDLLHNRFAVPAGEGEFDEAGRDSTQLAVSPRFGFRARLVEGLSLRLSGGRYFRAPSLLELFGDQGFARGRESLRPEQGQSIDAGLVLDREFGRRATRRWGVYAQTGVFAVFSRDLIAWVQAGSIVRPENLEGARVLGAEASAQVVTPGRWVIAQANYTFVDSMNLSRASSQHGQALPGRPRHEASGRVSVGAVLHDGQARSWEPRVFARYDYIAQNFLDPSGRLELPPRRLLGAGAQLQISKRVDLAFEVRNLLNQRRVAWTPPIGDGAAVPLPVTDFIGYPLPGRALWFTAGVQFP